MIDSPQSKHAGMACRESLQLLNEERGDRGMRETDTQGNMSLEPAQNIGLV